MGKSLCKTLLSFSQIWLDGEKAATVEYWKKDVDHHDIDKHMLHD